MVCGPVINRMARGTAARIRSITATPDGAVLLANVHVGGIPRSTDCGQRGSRPSTSRATSGFARTRTVRRRNGCRDRALYPAATVGDMGRRTGGLYSYCSAVAFAGDDVFVRIGNHFAAQGAIYRRQVDTHVRWSLSAAACQMADGIIDTGCIPCGSAVALAIRRATSTYRPTPAVAGRAGQWPPRRAASSSSESQQKVSPSCDTTGHRREVLTRVNAVVFPK
jgi:hypothetical protein